MASNQKIMSKNIIYFGIGLCVFIIIIFILFRGKKTDNKSSTTRKPNLPIFPVFPVIPGTDSFLEYYNTNGFLKDASTIHTEYDKFSENYNMLITSIESENSMGNIISGFSNLQILKEKAIQNEQEIIKLIDEQINPIIEKCDKIFSYDIKTMDKDRLASLSNEITDIKENIEKYILDYQKLIGYFPSNDATVEQYYTNINELYNSFIKSYNQYYEDEIKPSVILLNSIENKLPIVKDNPLYTSNSQNMEKVIEVSKFVEEFRKNINNIKFPIQEQYDNAKENYKKYKDIYKNISTYDEKFNILKSYLERLNTLNNTISQESQTFDNNMDRLNMFKDKISNFENNFMRSYNMPYNIPSEEEINSNKFSNIPIL